MEKLIKIVDTPINVEVLENWVADPTCGAVVSFLGKVRNKNHGKEVLELEYTTYVDMALKQLDEIVGEVGKKWSIKKCAVVHRYGNLKIGDIAVAIFITSEHRHDAFEACQYMIDELKKRVPIWKKEKYINEVPAAFSASQ
ncbi:MAG TPA: molybdenum cofactor biosynthesis protein MoaE [Bdellovibrionota bacterium]|nr:molybdenum cofactor biosynthesis protein MoaE [Bdellovibrionota bacterium]